MTCKTFYTSLVLLLVCVTPSIYSPEPIYGASLQWESNEEDDLAGYNLYCASSAVDHDLILNIGNVTEVDLNDLALYENVSYVMALTAYDLDGNESDFSTPLYITLDDGIDDFEDNCPDIYNQNQEDMYPPGGNGVGDICEAPRTTSSTTIPNHSPLCTTTIPPVSTTTTITECELDFDCPDDGLYCNGDEFCDEGTCVSTGNPCETELVCQEESDTCVKECTNHEDCDDELYCNGDELCVDGSCEAGTPSCPEQTTCDEDTDECKPTSVPITFIPAPEVWYQSRWIPLIALFRIKWQDADLSSSSWHVTFHPVNALWAMAQAIDNDTIFCMGLLMPRWMAPVDAIGVTVAIGADEVTKTMKIELLPLMMNQENNIM